jgi:hypothetical protein
MKRKGLGGLCALLVDPLSKGLDAIRRSTSALWRIERPVIICILVKQPTCCVARLAIAPLMDVVDLVPETPEPPFCALEFGA